MKLSKNVLKLIVASSALAVVTVSCDKENVQPNDDDRNKTEKSHNDDYCPACGMG